MLELVVAVASLFPQEPVRYAVALPSANAPVAVELRLPPQRGQRIFVMPRAIPMGYDTAPYDRFVRDLRAFDADGQPLAVEPTPRFGPRWLLGAAEQTVARVEYSVDVVAMERAILQASDTSKLRPGYAGLLGYSVFGYVEGLEARQVSLRAAGPEGWPVFSTLAPREEPAARAIEVEAADFYALADSQLILGTEVSFAKLAGEPAVFLACYAETEVQAATVGDLARRAMDALVPWFGSAPFAHYTVHLEYLEPVSADHAYGFSMEHMDSCTIFLGVDAAVTGATSTEQQRRTLYNLAHHMAHSWIPKRCAMAGYFPFSWDVAPVLDSIWFSEGFGQWAAMDALAPTLDDGAAWRDGVLEHRFRRNLASTPRFLRRMPLVEVSRVASTQYSSNFSTGMNVFARGALMAEEIDAAVKRASSGAKGLRDGLRLLVQRAAAQERPVTVDDLVRAVMDATDVDVRGIVDRGLQPMR